MGTIRTNLPGGNTSGGTGNSDIIINNTAYHIRMKLRNQLERLSFKSGYTKTSSFIIDNGFIYASVTASDSYYYIEKIDTLDMRKVGSIKVQGPCVSILMDDMYIYDFQTSTTTRFISKIRKSDMALVATYSAESNMLCESQFQVLIDDSYIYYINGSIGVSTYYVNKVDKNTMKRTDKYTGTNVAAPNETAMNIAQNKYNLFVTDATKKVTKVSKNLMILSDYTTPYSNIIYGMVADEDNLYTYGRELYVTTATTLIKTTSPLVVLGSTSARSLQFLDDLIILSNGSTHIFKKSDFTLVYTLAASTFLSIVDASFGRFAFVYSTPSVYMFDFRTLSSPGAIIDAYVIGTSANTAIGCSDGKYLYVSSDRIPSIKKYNPFVFDPDGYELS